MNTKKVNIIIVTLIGILISFVYTTEYQTHTYQILEVGVVDYYNNTAKISAPTSGRIFYGQEATYQGNQHSYTNNEDGTITDKVIGLMWQQDMSSKISYNESYLFANFQLSVDVENFNSSNKINIYKIRQKQLHYNWIITKFKSKYFRFEWNNIADKQFDISELNLKFILFKLSKTMKFLLKNL